MNYRFKVLIIAALYSVYGLAQERTTDTIDDQVVNVIKPYTPTIADAFKIKQEPKIGEESTSTRKVIKYNIFSIPVASTFTPAKGKAASVDKAKAVKLFDNYASFGVGTYTTVLGEVYLNHQLSNTETVGGYFSHHSSQGGIEDLLVDDDFQKTSLNANYSQKLRDFSWKIDAGFNIQSFNWYGIPQEFFTQSQANAVEPGHSFNSFYVGGILDFDDSIINQGSAKFRRFGDNQNSGENRFLADLNFDIPIEDQYINTEVSIDYINGSFDRNYIDNTELKYANTAIGLAPSYQLKEDDLTVDLGVRLVYLNNTENEANKFFIYPNIEASYRLVSEILIAYGGVKGELIQNSYYQFANDNPFVSPTLFITPTDQRYKGFLGLKGKLSNNVSYNIRGNYWAEESKALFKANAAQTFAEEDYQYGNSFDVVYDTVKTFSVAGELNIDVNRNFTLGIKGEYFNYSVDNEQEAWNLPDITGSIFLDYQISEKWYAGGSVFYVGERKDEMRLDGTFTPMVPEIITLDSFLDANAHLGYKINPQLSVFAKVNNIANQGYQRWLNFPVQSIQFLAGATYQFDF
ncbi:MAG: TonB-dependent receptor [Winogradskyella sp.]|nr:TonB-dependent receptor [Winogradskyella sp.]